MIKKEGYVKKYGNFVSGYKKCYLKIRGYYLIIQKGQRNKEAKAKVDLRTEICVETNPKDVTEFVLGIGPAKKPTKIFFKAQSQADRDAWIKALEEATNLSQSDSQSIQQDNNPHVEPFKTNLYEAFSSRLFVDECDYDTKLQAFQQIQQMFNNEIETLQDIVISTLQDEKGNPLIRNVINIKNLGKTMTDLIKNIVSEIDNSREEMFRILESIAAIEINKNSKKFNEKTNSIKKTRAAKQYAAESPSKQVDFEREKSQSLREMRPTSLEFTGEEFKYSENMKDSDSYSNFDQRSMSMVSVIDFGSDLDDEMFEDAQEEIVQTDQQLVKSKKCHIQDVYEERLTLPHERPPNLKISFWSILKNCIGKDLTRISMPVYFNEPLSMCQKMSEPNEYNEILETAALKEDSLTRLAYVSTYSISRYNSAFGRTLKPFNPLLGETFELVTHKYRLIAEQVSHHPPLTVTHCEGPNYQVFYQTSTSTKFNGRSLTFTPSNRLHVTLMLQDGTMEKYTVKLPHTSAHNLIIGTPYIDVHGRCTITNHTTKEECELEYVPRGWKDKTAGQVVEGFVKNAMGKQIYKIKGCWTKSASFIDIATGVEEEIWRAEDRPEKWDYLYHFSKFALQNNYLPDTLKVKLPPTDSRLRPDQRALENGNIELATAEKNRLEEAQRERKKKLEESNKKYSPAYFEMKHYEQTNEDIWTYNGLYWEDRAKRDWSRLTPIFQ